MHLFSPTTKQLQTANLARLTLNHLKVIGRFSEYEPQTDDQAVVVLRCIDESKDYTFELSVNN